MSIGIMDRYSIGFGSINLKRKKKNKKNYNYKKADIYVGSIEPSISELISDPIIKAVMKSDGLCRTHLIAIINMAKSKFKK